MRSATEPGAARISRWALRLATGVLALLAPVAVALHTPLERLLTHTVGVFVVLGELLARGVLYPPRPSVDLVYSAFYHPLAFAPIALLPGEGLDKVPWLRGLVGTEAIACLACVALLASRRGLRGVLAWQPALWALGTVPVAFSLIGMRDDPRATLLGLLAVIAFLRGGRFAPWTSAALLVLAFFTKATAPLAPGLAILFESWRRHGPWRAAWLLAVCGAGVAAGVALLQWGLGADFLHNGLYYAIVEPAKEPRTASEAIASLGRDVLRDPAGWIVGVLPLLLAASLGILGTRLARRRIDLFDVLVAGCWVKTLIAYRSIGTELNHLLDLSLLSALHVGVRLAPWLRVRSALALLTALVVLSWPVHRVLLPPAGSRALHEGHVAAAVAVLCGQPRVPTLCEEPLIAWQAGLRPLVTDPLLTFATLKRFPEIRRTWFGPADRPGALQRILLMRDPRPGRDPNYPDPESWYGPIHFDRAFLQEIRAHWQVVVSADGIVALVRRQGR